MHSVRYAHCEGFTEICCAPDKGQQVITAGEDGEVRIWQSFDDVDNRSFQVGEKCTALAYGDGKIYLADEQNEVKRYDYESGELIGVVTSFTLPVTSLCLNKSCTQIVCGSVDFEVQLVDLASLKSTKFTGHEAPILSLCFDPFQKYFISASCDSTARVWSVANSNTVKQFTGLHKKSNDFMDSESWCKIAWHKDGGLLAVPANKDIEFYERESWILKFKINLKNENNPGEEFVASILSFSPDGKHILAVTSTQMIYVHSIINKSLIYKYSYSKKTRICSQIWHQNEILFCDINGQMGQIRPSLKDNGGVNSEEPSAAVVATAAKSKAAKTTDEQELGIDDLMELLGDEEASNQESVASSSSERKASKEKERVKGVKSKITISPKKRKRVNDDESDENSRDTDAKSSRTEEEEELDEMADDLESIEKLKERAYKLAKKEAMLDDDFDTKETDSLPKKPVMIKEMVQIKPFQPSSTPLNLAERYMAWNSVGLITQFNRDEDDSIDIEFHNASHHHTIHLKNQLGYTMADMSREAVVLASPGSVDESQADELNEVLAQSVTSHSKLTCIMLNSLDASSKEWQLDMPKKEYIRCVCVSRLLLACATNRKFLRVFHLSGVQREIICLNGQPICLAAYDQKIFVCYTMDNNIGYSIYHLNNETAQTRSEHGVIPISGPESQLIWIGFSEEGNPYCLDSNGYLYLKCSTGLWTPLSHLRSSLTHKSDNYWLVGISERNQLVKAILCRASKYPNVLPRPNLTTVSISVPVCDAESEKSKLEQEYWRNIYLATNLKTYDYQSQNVEGLDEDELNEKVDNFESDARQSLMKLFMLACRTGKEQRAYDVATIMDVDTIQLAIKFATKSRALNLAHTLNNLAEIKMKKQTETAESQYDQFYSNPNVHQQSIGSMRDNIEDTGDIIVESIVNRQSGVSQSLSKSLVDTKNSELMSESYTNPTPMDESIRTPTIPLTNTRINPFNKSAKNTPNILLASNENNENNTPKTVLSMIEDKLNKKTSQSAKEKDAWKPTPARKLVKSKVSSGTPTIGSFLN